MSQNYLVNNPFFFWIQNFKSFFQFSNIIPFPVNFLLQIYLYLNYTKENKKYEIINLLEEKLTEIIEYLRDVEENKYTFYFKENKIIKNNFNPELLDAIDNN